MCNLYRMTKPANEVAELFAVEGAAGNFSGEVFPGYPGLVVADGALRTMTWGFPLVMRGKNGQKLKPKPVNNARTDKLESAFWSESFLSRRCLIPLTAWAEAQGPKGAKTRTWLSRPDAEIFACAGLWRESDAFGTCFSMVMTQSEGSPASAVHSRMPVLLRAQDYSSWLSAAPQVALGLCQPWMRDLTIERSDEPWSGGASAQGSLF